MKTIAAVLLFCCLVLAQDKPSSVQTKGSCSPVVTGNGNTITIKTCGLTNAEVQEWRTSFKQILDKQVDPKVLVALLDDIKSGIIRIEGGVLRIESAQKEQAGEIGQLQGQTWKRITNEDAARAASALAPFAGQKVIVVVANQDPDRLAVAEQLSKIFVMARWDWQGIQSPITFSDPKAPVPHGLVLHVGQVSPTAEALGNILISLYGKGNVPDGWLDPKFPKDVIEINIHYRN